MRYGCKKNPPNLTSPYCSCNRPKPIDKVRHNPIIDAAFPVDGKRIDDCYGLIHNANTPDSIRGFITNELCRPISDDSPTMDSLDDAELVSFDPSLQYGDEVDVCVESLNNYLNKNLKPSK